MKILVLDVGSFSIKALYFEKKYSGYNLISFSHTVIKKDPALSSMEQMLSTVTELKSENKYDPEKTMVIFPSDRTTSRFITLPFRDHKRINMTLPLELEEQLPFELKDIVYDWFVVRTSGRNTTALVTAVLKEELEVFVAAMKSAKLEPDVITTGSDALLSLSNFLRLGKELVEVEKEGIKVKETQYHPVLLVDVGASKTTVVITKDGEPEHVRIINYGGDYITKQIMKNYELSYEDAERSKVEVGYIILESDSGVAYTDEQVNFSNVLKNSYDIILRDINQTISSYRSDKHGNINGCYIAGAGWKTRNFIQYMAQELKLTVEPIEYCKNLGVKLPFSGTPDELTFANTVGFFLRFAGKTNIKGLNLIRDSKTAGAESLREYVSLFKPTIRNIVIALLVFVVYAFAHSFILSMLQQRYKNEVLAKIKTVFPDKDKKAQTSLVNNYQKLEKEIDARLKTQKALLGGENTQRADSAFTALKDLSSMIPQDLVVDILDMDINKKGIRVSKAVIQKGDDIQKLVDAAKKSGKFKDIKPGTVKNSSDGKGKEFDITFNYKGTDK
ncbi:MAG: pilus assembly protein PilM [Pseudomonadota bacterium]